MRKTVVVACAAVVLCLGARSAEAAGQAALPAQARSLASRLSANLQPRVRSWIAQEARKVGSTPPASLGPLRADVRAAFAVEKTGIRLGGMDVEAVVMLVMMQAYQDQEKDLREHAEKLKAINEEKKKVREHLKELREQQQAAQQAARSGMPEPQGTAPVAAFQPVGTARKVPRPNRDAALDARMRELQRELETLEEESEKLQFRLQTAQSRLSQIMQTIMSLLRAASEANMGIIRNLK